MGVIKIEDLTVSYDIKPVLWDVDLNIPKGSLTAIVGPNGAGKSTLIKAVLNLIKPVTGSILINDKPYKEQKGKVAYVPQKESVDWNFPTTVLDVVLMGRYGHVGWFKRVGRKDKQIAYEALKTLNIEDLSNRQISELSGGQQQRVFLARALTQEADIYLMDEPFQGVDIKTEKAIVDLFKHLKQLGKTIVVVHHDLDTVKTYFDYVVMLNLKVVESGLVEDVFTVENIQKTFQSTNILLSNNKETKNV